MEINRVENIVGVIPVEDVVEGRFVLLTSHSFSYDFGSQTEVPGCKLPDTDDESAKALYCLTFSPDIRPTPFYEPMPAMDWAMRGGWSEAANVPFSATVYLTHKGNQEGLTVPSGTLAIGLTEGVFTLPSGSFVYDANIIVPGASLAVANTSTDGASDAGKIKYAATVTVNTIGVTQEYDSVNNKLTVRIK